MNDEWIEVIRLALDYANKNGATLQEVRRDVLDDGTVKYRFKTSKSTIHKISIDIE